MADAEASKLKLLERPWFVPVAAALLIALHVLLAVAGTWNKGATFDENAYIGNGFSFWATGDYRMSPDAILTQRWITWPVYLAGYHAPPTDNESWYKGDVWGYGSDLLYRRGNDSQSILRLARFMTTLLSAILAWITFAWARKLCGTAGAFLALTFYALNPTILANASCASSDLASALTFTASIWALWTVLHRITPLTVLVSSLVIAAAFATKLSAVMLVPIGLLMAVVQLAGTRAVPWRFGRKSGEFRSRWIRAAAFAALVVVHVVVAWFVVWAVFGFRYAALINTVEGRDVGHAGMWEAMFAGAVMPLPGQEGPRNEATIEVVKFIKENRLLPEGFLMVFTSSLTTTSVRSAFLDGRYGIYGFPSFFPKCFLYKTPPAVFFGILLAIAAHVLRRVYQIRVQKRNGALLLWEGFYATAPLWILLVIYWTISITRGINIGIRHILPTFPATFILAGLAGVWLHGLMKSRSPEAPTSANENDGDDPTASEFLAGVTPRMRHLLQLFVGVCFVWQIGTTAWAFPNFLAYFNMTAGGSSNGYRHLVDSSLDWGQELPNLKRWLDEHKSELPPKVFVSYFGSTPPSAYAMDPIWMPGYFSIEQLERRPFPVLASLDAGVYCISATSLQCVYNQPYQGPWRTDYESDYQNLYQLLGFYMQNEKTPEIRDARLKQMGLSDWSTAFKLYDAARFGRLCAYLRRREPDAMINDAILIYRISIDELKTALLQPPAEVFPKPANPGDNVPY